jgi:hypothetical protein
MSSEVYAWTYAQVPDEYTSDYGMAVDVPEWREYLIKELNGLTDFGVTMLWDGGVGLFNSPDHIRAYVTDCIKEVCDALNRHSSEIAVDYINGATIVHTGGMASEEPTEIYPYLCDVSILSSALTSRPSWA